MCGLAGFHSYSKLGSSSCDEILLEMGREIQHRGPDDFGVWSDDFQQIGLVHRRLSIVDLSQAGRQPMISASGRYVIVFNGEIYNHLALRDELSVSNVCWRGHSDTETLLAGFENWGIVATIQKSIGMFAIAVWDSMSCELHLIRDRMGEKPLYYGWQDDVFMFASEIKPLKKHPAFKREIDRGSLALYMRHAYVPAPYSIYKGIRKLEPGTILTLSTKTAQHKTEAYWSLPDVALAGTNAPFQSSALQVVNDLETILFESVKQQMVADVPLGAFLSGGVDSSTVVALMQVQSVRPVQTFSIGFHEERYNEAAHAAAVAKYLGTDHHELYVTADQAMGVIPSLSQIYDEPFADSSQIPTYLVSKMARSNVTVALSGDAGDELFAGYNRYVITQNTWSRLSRLPSGARKILASTIHMISPATWDKIAGSCMRVLPERSRLASPGDKLHKAAAVLSSSNASEVYRRLVSTWMSPEALVLHSREPNTSLTDKNLIDQLSSLASDVERMMVYDMLTYLPDDILVKVDRAAMGVSLETRVPFLDHRVVEHAWRMPLKYKIHAGHSKWALRQVLYKHVPRELIERPKMGFGIPIAEWLRGPLREWAEELINPIRIKEEGFFNYELISAKWIEHMSGKRNWSQQLWCVLMFQSWLAHENVFVHKSN